MKPVDHALERLWRAARSASSPLASDQTLPPGLESQLLARRHHWMSRHPSEDLVALVVMMRRGLMAAALIALVTVIVCHRLEAGSTPAVDSLVVESVTSVSLVQ